MRGVGDRGLCWEFMNGNKVLKKSEREKNLILQQNLNRINSNTHTITP